MQKTILLSVLLAFLGVSTAHAGITLISGSGMQVINPANQRYYPDPYAINMVFYWPERTSYTLSSDLVVSTLQPGSFPVDTNYVDNNTQTISHGTVIDSYMLNYDPQGGSIVATFLFDDPIVGLITDSRESNPADDHFVLSDYLINPLVPPANIPSGHFSDRGIESASGDHVHWISANEIELHIGASSPGDQIRVITSAAVPEPGSLGVLAIGVMGLLMRGMRRRHVERVPR